MNRRELLSWAIAAPALHLKKARRRKVVVMLDGFGLEYYQASAMPNLKKWASDGVFVPVKGQMPAVTNTNNASICCGVPASVHGITGNSYLNPETGGEDYMEEASLLRAPTLFEKAARQDLKSGLFTAKKKTASLLKAGAGVVISAETPSADLTARFGAAPPIYSSEINLWLWDVVIDQLKRDTDLTVLYVHTTDYPMHMHPADAPESLAHLAGVDAKFAEAAHLAPDASFYITADHGMNHKTRAWDLDKACANRDAPIRLSISAEKDKYPRHHLGLGGIAWVYLREQRDSRKVATVLEGLEGVEKVLTRQQAAKEFDLMPERIGELVVTGDRVTVFGVLEKEKDSLEASYRSHGSQYETDVPLIIRDEGRKLDRSSYMRNLDLTQGMLG